MKIELLMKEKIMFCFFNISVGIADMTGMLKTLKIMETLVIFGLARTAL
jgi:hypothetical protein